MRAPPLQFASFSAKNVNVLSLATDFSSGKPPPTQKKPTQSKKQETNTQHPLRAAFSTLKATFKFSVRGVRWKPVIAVAGRGERWQKSKEPCCWRHTLIINVSLTHHRVPQVEPQPLSMAFHHTDIIKSQGWYPKSDLPGQVVLLHWQRAPYQYGQGTKAQGGLSSLHFWALIPCFMKSRWNNKGAASVQDPSLGPKANLAVQPQSICPLRLHKAPLTEKQAETSVLSLCQASCCSQGQALNFLAALQQQGWWKAIWEVTHQGIKFMLVCMDT